MCRKNKPNTVKGESQIPKAAGEVRRVCGLSRTTPWRFPPAIQAILTADFNPGWARQPVYQYSAEFVGAVYF
jgi:2-phospho-L-lactate transferase/gluconeogenesis factor (CofD/UPF0052 family)